jgi:hypothetical protein
MEEKVPKELRKFWIHSSEEDTDSIEVYRPKGYDFPPSRARKGFEIKENGEVIFHDLNSSDRPRSISGQIKSQESNKFRVDLKDREKPHYLDIVESTDQILRLKK